MRGRAAAHKLGLIAESDLAEAFAAMTTSNASASASALAGAAGVHAATDCTGFGALGSVVEMLDRKLGAVIDLARVPVVEAARGLGERLGQSRWSEANWNYALQHHRMIGVRDAAELLPLLDPQTNGGLLVAASEEAAAALVAGGFTDIGVVNDTNTIEVK